MFFKNVNNQLTFFSKCKQMYILCPYLTPIAAQLIIFYLLSLPGSHLGRKMIRIFLILQFLNLNALPPPIKPNQQVQKEGKNLKNMSDIFKI